LNALAPGRWREVTCLRGGRIAGYLRFVECRKRGLTICLMPQITRFLGPVVTVERAGLFNLAEGQKVSFEVKTDPRRGKTSAENLRV
jgi:hypothetical protein